MNIAAFATAGNRLINRRPGERAPAMARYRLDGEREHQEPLPDLYRSRVANVHLEPCLAERRDTANRIAAAPSVPRICLAACWGNSGIKSNSRTTKKNGSRSSS
jgi:hypothetical protein